MASLINGLGGDADFGENTRPRSLDYWTEVDLSPAFTSGLNFYGQVFTSLFINDDGTVTFGQPYGAVYTPFPITGESKAGFYLFFADVDTRGGPAQAPTPGGTSRGTNLVYWDIDPDNHRVIVTWDDVAHYSLHTDTTNAFQLVIEDRSADPGRSAGDVDVEFRYEAINWTTGDWSGGVNGLGGTVARAGYSNGDGFSFELPASGDQDAMLALEDTPGNTGEAGVWRFEIHNAGLPDRVALQAPPTSGFTTDEGDSGATLLHVTVVRAGNLSGTLTLDWSVTAPSSWNAVDAADFVGAMLPTGTITFADGQATADIAIAIQGDTDIEADEVFHLAIANPVGSEGRDTLITRAGVDATILNDDHPPTLSITPYVVGFEGDAGEQPFFFVLTRTGDTSQALTATVAIRAPGGGLFTASADDLVGGERMVTVTIAAGETSGFFDVRVIGDRIQEFDETFYVDIVDISGGAPGTVIASGSGVGVIRSDDGYPPGIFGDPHLVTLDGTAYDFQASGEFLLIETLPGVADAFRVQARLAALPGDATVTWVTRLTVEAHGTSVGIGADGSRLSIGGQVAAVEPGSSGLDLDGDGTPDLYAFGSRYVVDLGRPSEQLVVQVNDGWLDASVLLDTSRAGLVRGLLGDMDGNPENDFRMHDGVVLQGALDPSVLYGVFADSWRVDGDGASAFAADITRATGTDGSAPIAPDGASGGSPEGAPADAAESIGVPAAVAPVVGDHGDDTLSGGASSDTTILVDTALAHRLGGSGGDSLSRDAGNDTLGSAGGPDSGGGGTEGDLVLWLAPTPGRSAIGGFIGALDDLAVSASGFGGRLIAGVALTAVQVEANRTDTAAPFFVDTRPTGVPSGDVDGTIIAAFVDTPAITAGDLLVVA